ncbi:restriction endonuclease [Candidatus Roizmanbacteria bacterium CG22_combo_CG10-13_8_21_14_all_35_9]|uniref:Restriction endonuclease n=3 Tax=Candidatus Roizmaniibacteriota TaxID=1752723 RepID=A0A2H0BZ28_9BACT|nr:MAG: restriction endonuclease [Candidatus Roizmanbacteria bacterium CG22_combo_CG10-13_8_21_14_all_35_9]PIY71419.1 MAG: restriction endonuclease [Candidatus Roizmanbacteria bacterium CG_4_10_14_0_8_um_filter_35_28]
MKKVNKLYSKAFGKKEKVLNYACQTYQLSRPNKVGPVMFLIRECQPKTFQEWEKFYFEKAFADGKNQYKITKQVLDELGERLYIKIKQIVIPEWTEAFNQLTIEDCKNYIYNLTVNRTYDGFIREKSVIYDNLAKIFPEVKFIETDPKLDQSGDVDYLGCVDDDKAFGIQIKPVTAKANFGNYSISQRMKGSFKKFKNKFGGEVFIVFSIKEQIQNKEIIEDIRKEIKRLIRK